LILCIGGLSGRYPTGQGIIPFEVRRALWNGLAYLSRYNSGWFCHNFIPLSSLFILSLSLSLSLSYPLLASLVLAAPLPGSSFPLPPILFSMRLQIRRRPQRAARRGAGGPWQHAWRGQAQACKWAWARATGGAGGSARRRAKRARDALEARLAARASGSASAGLRASGCG
jgi:hypothetical protein